LLLVGAGLAAALPFALSAAGGIPHAWQAYHAVPHEPWSSSVSWWDVSIMLMLGGVPWNCYFQRVLSCRSPRAAQLHSIYSGLLTIVLTIPPLLMGIAAFAYLWPPELAARLGAQPADALPLMFRYGVPPLIGLLGLAAIVGAVTSSFSSSILSAGSMFSWNVCLRLLRPDLPVKTLSLIMRAAIVTIGALAVWMAIKVQSVQALWFFTSDLVFVLLFPQLIYALFDRRVNRAGSIAAFVVSLALRVAAGEPLLGIPPLIAHSDAVPFRTVAAATGLLLLPIVSRATARWSAPLPLRNPELAPAETA
jgi:high affinity choline transporter 7